MFFSVIIYVMHVRYRELFKDKQLKLSWHKYQPTTDVCLVEELPYRSVIFKRVDCPIFSRGFYKEGPKIDKNGLLKIPSQIC